MLYSSYAIVVQFFRRDWYAHMKYVSMYIINYSLLLPGINAFAFCFLQGSIFFGSTNTKTITAMFAGNLCLPLFILTYRIIVPLLYDLQKTRFIEYQTSLVSARLVLVERILFTACLAAVFMMPFYPIAKIIAGSRLDTSAVSWPSVALMICAASLMCSTFNMFAVCFIRGPYQLSNLWARCNIPMLVLSSWIPWNIIKATFPSAGYVALCNPMLYVTEGLRQAFLAEDIYLSLPVCLVALAGYSCLFTLLAWYFFKQRTDHC